MTKAAETSEVESQKEVVRSKGKKNDADSAESKAKGPELKGPYAVIKAGGRQYTVTPGQRLLLNKIDGNPGDAVTISDVLLMKAEAGSVLVGSPLVSGAAVKAKVVAQTQGEKIRIFKKKRRTGYTKRQGHRQQLTELVIQSIEAP